MAFTFQLTEARVMGDGRVVRLRWEAGVAVGQAACNRLASTGFPDYRPGINAGATLTVNGMTAEILGTQSEDHNRPQAWIEGFTTAGGDGLLPLGHYLFHVVLVDPGGNERVTHHFIGHGDSTRGTTLQGIQCAADNSKATIYWREPCPVGWSVRIYATTNRHFDDFPNAVSLKVQDMTVVAEVPYANLDPATAIIPAGTSYTLKSLGVGGAALSYASTTWWQDWLVPNPIPFAAPVTISAPAGLIQDELGNATEVLANNVATGRAGTPTITTVNDSLVNTDGWIAVPDNATGGKAPYGNLTFTKTVHVSYTYGNDTTAASNLTANGTAIAFPYKTVSAALAAYNSTYTNINVRLLRGDSWPPGEYWTVAHWGTSRATPFCLDSYWNPAYGTDPGTRPIVNLIHPYWDARDSETIGGSTFWLGQSGGAAVPVDHWNYVIVRGIKFLADPGFQSGQWSGMPASGSNATPGDHQIISDCEFYNYALIPHNGTEGVPPTGSMFHRIHIHHTVAWGMDSGLEPQAAGLSTVTLPNRMANAWIGNGGSYGIHAGDTNLRILGTAPNWNLLNWTVVVTDLITPSHTETKTITSNTNFYSVDTPFAYTYSWKNAQTSVSLRPCTTGGTNTTFKIRMGSGSDAGVKTYTITAYDPLTRIATIDQPAPAIDATTRIKWQPELDTGNHASGVFMDQCSDFLFSQVVIDQCGWGRPDNDRKWNSPLSHGMYLSYQALKICIWGSWITNNCSYGVMQRGGGTSAYNVFALNTHVSYHGATSGTFRKILATQNGQYPLSTSATYDNVANHYVFDSNIIMSSTGKNELGTANSTASGRDCIDLGTGPDAHAMDHLVTAPKHMRAWNNTFIDSGGVQLIGSPPVTGVFVCSQNIVANRPGTGVDYQSNPYRANTYVPGGGWNTLGRYQVADDDTHVAYDKNVYLQGSGYPYNAFAWRTNSYSTFAAYKAAGHEPNSIAPASIAFANGSYSLDSWAAGSGLGANLAALRVSLTTREYQTWADGYDAIKCYQAFQAAYTPDAASVPAIDGTRMGYYGASDNRASNGGVGGPVIYRARVGRGAQMFRHLPY